MLKNHSNFSIEAKENTDTNVTEADIDIEQDVFWVLVYILNERGWRTLYTQNTPKLQKLLEKLDAKIAKKLPTLHKLLDKYVRILI